MERFRFVKITWLPPLANPLEWITAHTLITCDIWEKNGGPSAYGFSPVYTYPGEGNARRTMLGGVVDEKGDVYYVSYPPFSFLFAYYATKIFGGANAEAIRMLGISIHLICAIMLYLVAVSLRSEKDKTKLSIAGLTAAFLYLFSSGNLWAHGNLYFADILVQPLLILALYLVIRFIRNQFRKEWLFICLLSLLCFFGTYTEWLGLFFSFFAGLTFLVFYFFKKEKRYLKAFFAVGFSAAFALALTVVQYSSIAGWDKLKEVSTSKYEERSGRSDTPPDELFTIESSYAYDFMIQRTNYNYKMVENFVGIFAVLFVVVLLIPVFRKNMNGIGISSLILLLVLSSVGLHYVVFFNFNALHDFASLKAGFVFVLISTVFILLIESALKLKFKVALLALIVYLALDKGMESVERYHQKFSADDVDWDRIETGKAMQKYGDKDKAVFMNIFSNPELVLSCKA